MKSWSRLFFRRAAGLLLAVAVAVSGMARAQGDPPPFKPEEIEALVAPIALYPDSLLSQVLMASTYPLEIVQAARWSKANPNLKGDEAVKAVEGQPWDVSVKSLVAFPQILEPMDQKIDWTQKLGDAFLADEKAVLDAVQRLRAKANQSGNLQSSEQQKVIVEQAAPQQTVIRIEPANPQVIYVPAYNPTVVYGGWGYPAYPPYYWPPSPVWYPGGALVRGFAWGVGFAAAGAIFGGCNWGGGNVDIDINRAVNIDKNFDRTKASGGKWQHDASHRKGAAYRDPASREKFGKDVPGRDGRNDYRGRDGAGGDRAGTGDRGGPGDRGGAGDRGDRGGPGDRGGAGDRAGPAGDRAGPGDRGGAGDRGGPSAGAADRGGGRDNAFSGVGGGAASQRDLDRGRASNSSMANRGGGGGAGFSGGGAAARPTGGAGAARPSAGAGGARAGGGGGRGGRR